MPTPCTPTRCPQCSDPNPAVVNRSDGLSSYRCESASINGPTLRRLAKTMSCLRCQRLVPQAASADH